MALSYKVQEKIFSVKNELMATHQTHRNGWLKLRDRYIVCPTMCSPGNKCILIYFIFSSNFKIPIQFIVVMMMGLGLY